jgi:hypothetical protein
MLQTKIIIDGLVAAKLGPERHEAVCGTRNTRSLKFNASTSTLFVRNEAGPGV